MKHSLSRRRLKTAAKPVYRAGATGLRPAKDTALRFARRSIGLGVLVELMEEEVVDVVGPRSKPDQAEAWPAERKL